AAVPLRGAQPAAGRAGADGGGMALGEPVAAPPAGGRGGIGGAAERLAGGVSPGVGRVRGRAADGGGVRTDPSLCAAGSAVRIGGMGNSGGADDGAREQATTTRPAAAQATRDERGGEQKRVLTPF